MYHYSLLGLLLVISAASADDDCTTITENAKSAISSGDGNASFELYNDSGARNCISAELLYGLITVIRHARGESSISARANENNPENLKQLCSQYLQFQNIEVPAVSWHQLNSTLFYFEKWQCQINYFSGITFADVY